jgi:hypothetical protein
VKVNIGDKFNMLKVVAYVGKDKYYNKIYSCKCDCGNMKNVLENRIKTNATKSCGCLRFNKKTEATLAKMKEAKACKIIDLTGKKFNRLTIIGLSHQKGNFYWDARCDCGKFLKVNGGNLKNGHSKSCGCLNKEKVTARRTKHNLSGTRIYKIWTSMISRCNQPKDYHYKWYGSRGISVCSRWLHSFENFYEDMGERPEGRSLDRINNDGDYSPDNCRWSTYKEQANNTRKSAKYNKAELDKIGGGE